MRAAAFMIAILGLPALLAGCPTPDGGDGTDTAPDAISGGDDATPVAGAEPSGAQRKVASRFEVDGLKLGRDAAQVLERYPADGELTMHPYWAEEGVTGVVAADRSDGSTAELENVYFLDGQLVGFARHLEQTEEAFTTEIEALSAIAGEPQASPPAWALETRFFDGFEEAVQEDFITYQHWGDEAARVIMMAMYNEQLGGSDYMLLHTEYFDECLSATAQAGEAEQPPAAQPPPPPPPPVSPLEDPELPSEPGLSGHYLLDGVRLGSAYDEVSRRYPDGGELATTEAWTEDGQTGMITATAADGTPRTESTVFLDGRLVGFSRVEPANAEQFGGTVDALTATFGKAAGEPPMWVQDSAFFADGGYQPAPPHITPWFWADEDSRTVLMALLDTDKGAVTTMLADADRYQPAMRLAMRAAMKKMMNEMQEQEQPPLTVPSL